MYLQIRSVLRVAACLVLAGGGGSRALAGFYSATFITSTICNPTHRRNTLLHTVAFAHYLLIIVADTAVFSSLK